jgi:hypothetical protein
MNSNGGAAGSELERLFVSKWKKNEESQTKWKPFQPKKR